MRASTFLTAPRVGRRDSPTTTDTVIPNRFILQLADVSDQPHQFCEDDMFTDV